MVLAAALWATGRRKARRAAWRGLGSMAAASTAANVIGKGLTGRRCPYADVPVRKPAAASSPGSPSFPSGHAANAAAFAIGAAIELPSLAAPGIALASAVGASRVATGVHYPSDVRAGTAIGAAAGLATLRWWPRRPGGPPWRSGRRGRHRRGREGLALMVNTSAGTASTRLARRRRRNFPRPRSSRQTRPRPDRAAAPGRGGSTDPRRGRGGGTVRTASAVARETGLPRLVIPAGTLTTSRPTSASGPPAMPWPRCGPARRCWSTSASRRASRSSIPRAPACTWTSCTQGELEGRLGKRPAEVVGLIKGCGAAGRTS